MTSSLMEKGQQNIARHRIKEAAYWLTMLDDEELDASDKQEFELWFSNHPHNRTAFERMAGVAGRFTQDSFNSTDIQVLNQVLQGNSRRSLYAKSGSVLSLLLLFFSAIWYQTAGYSYQYLTADVRSSGELSEVILDDGSRLVLDAMSAVNIDYSESQRRIELTQGQIYLDVITNPERPFVVATGGATATALGTSFSVTRRNGDTLVTVTESKVELCNLLRSPENHHQTECVRAEQGEHMKIENNQLVGPEAVDVNADTSWLNYRLVADDIPLPDLLARLDRYYGGVLMYSSDDIGDIRVSGVFPTNDIGLSFSILAKHPEIEFSSYADIVAAFERQSDL